MTQGTNPQTQNFTREKKYFKKSNVCSVMRYLEEKRSYIF